MTNLPVTSPLLDDDDDQGEHSYDTCTSPRCYTCYRFIRNGRQS